MGAKYKAMNTSTEIKKTVRDKYAEIANQSKDQNLASCCGATSSCCGDDVYNIMADDYSKLDGYNPDADLGLGCGLPTKFAKIKAGDILISVDNKALIDSNSMLETIAALQPGKTVALKLLRNQREVVVQVNIGRRPSPKPQE